MMRHLLLSMILLLGLVTTAIAAPVTELPRLLSDDDVKRYQQLFRKQVIADWGPADNLMKRIDNDVLIGTALYQRYMHPSAWRSTYPQLHLWLKEYRDHAGAHVIYTLARKRRIGGWKPIPKPVFDNFNGSYLDKNSNLANQRGKRIRATAKTRALTKKARTEYLKGKDESTLKFADRAVRAQKNPWPEALWLKGLALWRMGEFAKAADAFEQVHIAWPDINRQQPWQASAAAFWAGRARINAQHPARALDNFRQAAAVPRSFYGLLALETLGLDFDLRFTRPALAEDDLAALMDYGAVRRAMALVEIGDPHRADLELRTVIRQIPEALRPGLVALIDMLGLPSVGMHLAGVLGPGTDWRDWMHYPSLPWKPEDGFKADEAMIHALIRQESHFKPGAKSRVGARGLMQVMPRTAAHIMQDPDLRKASGRNRLLDPAFNLQTGQKYINILLREPHVGGDLFKMAIAWNAGPGNLNKWLKRIRFDNDSLLFIESIPSRETRKFVEHVLANYWMYQKRLGHNTDSLNAVARGLWPGDVTNALSQATQ